MDDSVYTLVNECKRMIEDIDDNRIDTMSVKTDLQKAVRKLVTKYNRDEVYDDKVISKLKDDCNRQAIRLEYCLSQINPYYEERYKLRCKVQELIDEIDKRIANYRGRRNYKAVCQLLSDYPFVQEMNKRIQSVLIDASSSDIDKLRAIRDKEVDV